MTIKELLKKYGGTKSLAFAGNISEAQVNNLKSQGRIVEKLDNGGYVLISKKTIIFEDCEK